MESTENGYWKITVNDISGKVSMANVYGLNIVAFSEFQSMNIAEYLP